MSVIKKNILANYIGNIWVAFMGVAFIPLYIKYLGMESYALIGLFTSLQAWLVILDLGLTPTLNREMARFKGGEHNVNEIRDLLKTLNIIYFIIAAVITLSIVASASWLAKNWLQVEKLSVNTVSYALMIMGFVISMRWLCGLYRGAIMGLQKQVLLNFYNIIFSTIRWAGVIVILIYISPTINAFFIYQGIISVVEALVLFFITKKILPKSIVQDRFNLKILKKVWSFTAGIAVVNILSIILTQMDKLLLSKLLTLTEFGFYVLAGTIAHLLYFIVTPISNAALPRMTELVTKKNINDLTGLYHQLTQLMAIIIIPLAIFIFFNAEEILYLWINDEEVSKHTSLLLSILIMGTMINCIIYMPYLLQIANGWTSLAIYTNIISIVIFLPAIYFSVKYYGAIGSAMLWLIINIGYLFIIIPIMHKVLLINEIGNWYKYSVFYPLLSVVFALAIFQLFIPFELPDNDFVIFLMLFFMLFAGFFASILITPLGKRYLNKYFIGKTSG